MAPHSETSRSRAIGGAAPDLAPESHWLRDAERHFAALGSPSPLGTVLITMAAPTFRGTTTGAEVGWGVVLGTCLFGYAARMAAPTDIGHAPGTEAIESALSFTAAGEIDYATLSRDLDRVDRLAELAAALARDLERAVDPVSSSPTAWRRFSLGANRRLRTSFIRRGIPRSALPHARSSDLLLRLGYVIRVIDEIAGETPSGSPRATLPTRDVGGDLPSDGSEVTSETWLHRAVLGCGPDLDPVLEPLLERCALGVLRLAAYGSVVTEDEETQAVASARLGFVLRELEAALSGAPRPDRSDAFIAEVDRRCERSALPAASAVEFLIDVVRYGYCGGAEAVISRIEGESAQARMEVFAAAVERCCDDEVSATLAEVVPGLLHLGYLLHRIFELRPGWFGTAATGSTWAQPGWCGTAATGSTWAQRAERDGPH